MPGQKKSLQGVAGGLHVGVAWELVSGPQEVLPGYPAEHGAPNNVRTFPFLLPGASDDDNHIRAKIGVGRSRDRSRCYIST